MGDPAAAAAPVDPQERLQHALDLAYRHLSRRARTVAEIRRHLAGKGVGPATVDEAVDELLTQGYLDDRRYAEQFTEDRRRLDGWGRERIERRLREAGVPAEVVEEVLGGSGADDERDAALEVLRRRLGAPPTDDRERERALGLLARRGYDLETAYEAVRAYERSSP